MSCLYLYAVASRPAPARELRTDVRGFEGRAVRWRTEGDLVAAVGRLAHAPAVELDNLRAHDRVVRRLSTDVPAILPMRFGQALASDAELAACLERADARIRAALAEVAGCEQMTLRVFGERAPAAFHASRAAGGAAEAAGAADQGPGARYLAARARRGAPAPPVLDALAPLLAALAPWTRSQRLEGANAGSLLGSVYHLVSKSDLQRYARTLEDRRAHVLPLRVRASGPWLPYAFATGAGDA